MANLVKKKNYGLFTKQEVQTLRKYKEFEAKYKLLMSEKRQQLAEYMRTQNVNYYNDEISKVKITYKASYESTNVDTKKLKDKYPDVYNDCLKSVKKSETVAIEPIYD